MNIKNFLIVAFCMVEMICSSQSKKINGLSFVASRDSISYEHINPAKETNANFVSLMPFGSLSSLDSPEIRYRSIRKGFGEVSTGVKQNAQKLKKQTFK